jgi:zinc/manganese transport system substrate-binding protein
MSLRSINRLGRGACALAVVLAAAGSAPARAGVAVVATVPGLAALAREVGGPDVQVKALARAQQDPHFVDPKPSLALTLNRTDLVLIAGLDLEAGWLPTLLTGARNPRIQIGAPGHLDCSRFVAIKGQPAAKVDRSAGDIHPGGSPHYLYDPRAAAHVARGIAARLGELDPDHATAYRSRGESLVRRLEKLRSEWERRMEPHRGRPVIAYHDSFVYLSDWLRLPVVAFLEPKPGIPPNPAHVARLLAVGRQQRVALILQEEHHPDATARLVAAKIPARHLKVPADVDFDAGQTYEQYLELLVAGLERALAEGRARGAPP